MKVDTVFLKSMSDNGKTTIPNYERWHIGSTGAKALYGTGSLVGIMVENKRLKEQKGYMATLDQRCLASIEGVLSSADMLNYVKRSDIGLSGLGFNITDTSKYYAELETASGITAMIKVQLSYDVSLGFKKQMQMGVVWDIFSPQGELKYHFSTQAISDIPAGVFPDSLNPKHEETYVGLAGRNAELFLIDLQAQINNSSLGTSAP